MLFGIRLIGLCREANDWGVWEKRVFLWEKHFTWSFVQGSFVMGCDDYKVKELIQDRIGRR